GVRNLRGDVDRVVTAVEHVEVLGERLPTPADALVQRGPGDVLDALHERDQPFVPVRADGCEAHAAVPHDDRGDALPRRRREQVVPGDLPVVVGVDVAPARCDSQAVGVELLVTLAGDGAHRGDAPAVDCDVRAPTG